MQLPASDEAAISLGLSKKRGFFSRKTGAKKRGNFAKNGGENGGFKRILFADIDLLRLLSLSLL